MKPSSYTCCFQLDMENYSTHAGPRREVTSACEVAAYSLKSVLYCPGLSLATAGTHRVLIPLLFFEDSSQFWLTKISQFLKLKLSYLNIYLFIYSWLLSFPGLWWRGSCNMCLVNYDEKKSKGSLSRDLSAWMECWSQVGQWASFGMPLHTRNIEGKIANLIPCHFIKSWEM